MNTINGDTAVSMQAMGAQPGNSQMEAKAKSMGVPDDIIAKGQGAIKAWAKENGIVPGAAKTEETGPADKVSNNLVDQLDSNGISYESFSKAMEKGPEAVEDLFTQNNFSFNIEA